jgi:putative membrane protein
MAGPSETSLPDATRLAIDRTRLAHERTMMAWVRTATSLISFGFSIDKFFASLRPEQQSADDVLIGPREFALIMMTVGLAALTLATIEHRRNLQALRDQYGHHVPYSLSTVLAGLIALLGVLGLLSVAL